MKIAHILLVGCLLWAAPGPAWAQTNLADDEAIRLLYDKFFEAFRQGGAAGAVGYLRQSGAIEENVLRTLQGGLQKMEADPLVGRSDSYAVVNETEIPHAPRYRTFYFLTHHDSRPVAWRLRFYKKVTGVWVFAAVQWETVFVEDFLRLSELEFAAYRRILERAAPSRRRDEDNNFP